MTIRIFTANEAKTHFGEFLDSAQISPVRVTRRDRVVGILVSAQEHEAMHAFYANRVQATLIRQDGWVCRIAGPDVARAG